MESVLLSPIIIASVYRLPTEFRNRVGIGPVFAWTLVQLVLAITYELCYASQCFFFFYKVDIKIVAVQKVSSLL